MNANQHDITFLRELGATRIVFDTERFTLREVEFGPAAPEAPADDAMDKMIEAMADQLNEERDIEWAAAGVAQDEDAWNDAAEQVRKAARGEDEDDG